ncbi:EAL domain-containing protein [Marinobacter changyiensis]|uniref:EAL domain-containing protein n=1 Tax=Marinobacter changyiensis TaxID=2604091 RepID=UPI0012657C17|nr:EAL domain-containing protein [Marinobacter changyiensis]
MDDVIQKMTRLTDLGIEFSVDDFGTGYSSLHYLRRLPIRELKIDKSFVLNAPDDPMDTAIIATIYKLGEFFGLRIVAEGVETKQHAEFLHARFPCAIHQGFFYSLPIPMKDWIKNQLLL